MGVRTTSKHAAPGNGPTPWMDGHLEKFFNSSFDKGGAAGSASPAATGSENPAGHTATGGVISDYMDPSPGKVWRAHIFNSSGTFAVTALSGTYPAAVDYLIVAGGGGGGSYTGGGGARSGCLMKALQINH